MLILRRRPGETLLIGDNITLRVLETSDGSVRLAIDAPREVKILRGELVQAVDANRDAANEQARPEELQALLGGLTRQEPPSGESEKS